METASFALIAHDLKNALGALECELEALIDQPDPGLAQSAYVHCTELRRQFVQFLTVYGAGDGLKVHSEDESPLDMLKSLQHTAALKRLITPGTAKVTLKGDGIGMPSFWYLDRRVVYMALEAALHNAVRFSRHQVVMGAREQDGYLVLSIDDDGPGLGAIDPSDQSTGLGTALCEAVAKAHRCDGREGRVTLINRPEGGASFELWLP
ncbi:HAMP domain-containing sensor histidine kinase [Aquabacterium sp.]|uniref:sensor histidine kinase n=1 Tax=Aquabacterium sp. TaxID=1872578 RepID=UPI0024887AE0|nr:HAMP domain-containing sensor histidine kinase [Aquabacterium sp.]MDI1259043.1 HAMP domain-containing sensor histidine kinase [Aquabacterium sp.]